MSTESFYDNNYDAWAWWKAKLAGMPVEMNEGTPHAGFFRKPHKEQYGARRTFTPIAYWPGWDGRLCCRVGDTDVTPERGQDLWVMVGNHPVSEEAYRAVAEDGKPWPDEHELVPMGDNLPPEDMSYETLFDQIEDLAREAIRRIEGPPIADQAEADRIANLADRLAELCHLAEEQRKEERRPYDEGMKAVQKKWAPVLLKAETYKDLKYKLLTPWLSKLKQAQEEQAKAAAAAGTPPTGDARRPRAGTRGRAMTLKSLKHAEITDYKACLAFFADSPDIKMAVQDLANRAVRSGITVPGVNVLEEQKAV